MWPEHAKCRPRGRWGAREVTETRLMAPAGAENFESMKKAIKTEIMNSFFCSLPCFCFCFCLSVCLSGGLTTAEACSGWLTWVKGSAMESTSPCGDRERKSAAWSCSGWLAWGVTVFNCSHIWRRVAICQKTSTYLTIRKLKNFYPCLLPPPTNSLLDVPVAAHPTYFLITIIKSCCTNVFHFGCRSVINWKTRKKVQLEVSNVRKE